MSTNRPASCLNHAYRFLARRDHSESELRRKLETRGYENAEIDEAIASLIRAGYINDEAYIANFARARVERMRLGPGRLKADLVRKGFAEKLIEKAVAALFGDYEDEAAVARQAAEKKARSLKKDIERRAGMKKVYDHLMRRGFSAETARRIALDEYDELVDN